MEAFLSWLGTLVDPQSARNYRTTFSPETLAKISLFCPWVVYGRIENRLSDLERGGDGFAIPYCDCNVKCCCGAFQL